MRSVILFAATVFALAGCAATDFQRAARETNPAPCPNIFVLDQASRFVEFGGAEPSLSTVQYSGEIDDVVTSCRYYADTPIFAEVEMAMSIGRVDVTEAETFMVDYFVAVTRTNRDVLAKETYRIPVSFKAGESVVSLTQAIDKITIPRSREGTSGVNFEIAVGFALNEQQFRFNRSGKSLKFPES